MAKDNNEIELKNHYSLNLLPLFCSSLMTLLFILVTFQGLLRSIKIGISCQTWQRVRDPKLKSWILFFICGINKNDSKNKLKTLLLFYLNSKRQLRLIRKLKKNNFLNYFNRFLVFQYIILLLMLVMKTCIKRPLIQILEQEIYFFPKSSSSNFLIFLVLIQQLGSIELINISFTIKSLWDKGFFQPHFTWQISSYLVLGCQ